ncbi:MAG: hypothetical protein QW728_02055, partial [Thermoplasmata archaeon]
MPKGMDTNDDALGRCVNCVESDSEAKHYLPYSRGSQLPIRTFSNGESAVEVNLGGNNSTGEAGIKVEFNSSVYNASMTVGTSLRYYYNGTEQIPYAPRNVTVDVGNDGILEFNYSGKGYGAFGLQDEFSGGQSKLKLNLTSSEASNISILLPADAQIDYASAIFKGYSKPKWSPEVRTINYTDNSTNNTINGTTCEAHSPSMVEFQGKLFIFWETTDPRWTEGNESDIVYQIY